MNRVRQEGNDSYIQGILNEIFYKDNAEMLAEVEGFLSIYDRMPKQMKLILDLRITGFSPFEISQALKISQCQVLVQLNRAKKRVVEQLLFPSHWCLDRVSDNTF